MRPAILLCALSLHAQTFNTPRTIESIDLGNDSTLISFLTDRDGNRYYLGNTRGQQFPSTPFAFRPANTAHSFTRSDDAGRTFKRLDNLLPDNLALLSIATDGRTLYGQNRQGIWISRNAGDTWQVINPNESLAGLAIDPLNPRHLLAIRFDAVFESNDEGRTWLPSSTGIPNPVNRIFWSKAAPTIQVALTLTGLYVRSGNSPTWSFLSEANTSTVLAFAPPGLMYFSNNGRLFSWSPTEPQPRPITTPQVCRNPQTHPREQGWLRCDNSFLSLNGGATWTQSFVNERFAASDDGLYTYNNEPAIYRNGERIYLGRTPTSLIAEAKTLFVFAPPTIDAFITKRTPSGQPIYTTLLGGIGDDVIDSAAVDPQGNLYIAGRSNSEDLEGAYGYATTTYLGYVMKFAPNGAWLGGYSYPGNRAFYASPSPIQLAPNGDVYVLNGQDEILRFDRDLTQLQLRAAIPQSTLTLIESFTIGPDNTIYIAGYDSRPISRILHYTRDLTPIDTREFDFGFIVKQIAFDSQQRLITGGWFYRLSTACASPLFTRGVVLDTRLYRGDTTVNITATCDSFLNRFTISPTGQLAVLYNRDRLAYVDWLNPPPTTRLPLNQPTLLWQGTSLQLAGNGTLIQLLEYTPLLN